MPDFVRVSHPTYSPSRCFLCHRQDGPMVSVGIDLIQVGTAHGAMDIEGHVYLCIGDEINVGCAVQIARHAGMVDAHLYDASLHTIRLLEEALAAKDETIAQLEEGAPKVVALEDARELVASGKVTVPRRPPSFGE